MFKQFNSWKRKTLLARHARRNGSWYIYFGERIFLWPEASRAIHYLLYMGRYEKPEASLIRKYVNPGMNVIELGGSLGIVSQFTRKHIGPDATQVIVEADPELARICRETQEKSVPNPNTQVVPAAIAYGSPTITFAHGKGNVHVGRLAGPADGPVGENKIEVPTCTLAKLREMLPDDSAAALICDVEGAELDIIRNEPAEVAKFAIWLVEFHPHIFAEKGSSEAEFFDLCDRAGLEVLEIMDSVAALRPKNPA
jgi:FkbM family methyltransferase